MARTAGNAGLRPARAVLRTAHGTTATATANSHLRATPKRERDAPEGNAGFSRHSPPQAGGGTTSFAGMARLRVPPLALATNHPRPCGPRCRLKPAFQAGCVACAFGRRAEVLAPAGSVIAGCSRPPVPLSLVLTPAGSVIAGYSGPQTPLSLGAPVRRSRYRWVLTPADPVIAGCSRPPAPLSLGAPARRFRYRWVLTARRSRYRWVLTARRPRYRWVLTPADPVIAGCSRPPISVIAGCSRSPTPLSLGAPAGRAAPPRGSPAKSRRTRQGRRRESAIRSATQSASCLPAAAPGSTDPNGNRSANT